MPTSPTEIPPAPQRTEWEAMNQETFLGLMWALSHPGQCYQLPTAISRFGPGLLQIGAALLDLETSYWTDSANLEKQLSEFGARNTTVQEALYQFVTDPLRLNLEELAEASVGTFLRPDSSATIILNATIQGTSGTRLLLSGPGIDGGAEVTIAGVPVEFWKLRSKRLRYPLGWDLFLVETNQIMGFPRTTLISLD